MTGVARPDSAEARIDELESRLAFQDDTINSLNRALVEQQQRITALEKFCTALLERLDEGPGDSRPPEEQPPPHY